MLVTKNYWFCFSNSDSFGLSALDLLFTASNRSKSLSLCAMAKSFEEFKLNRQILNAVADAGYTVATPIQEKAIAPVLSGQDIFGIAETGTGKTAAFVLPILMQLKYAQGDNPRALILSPTRELAMQIAEQVKLFSTYTDLRSLVIFGGIGPKTQKEQIAKGVDILIATPGRFLDLYLAGDINTQSLKFLVLDEADKMMDMGFIGSIHRILEIVPRKRQNLLFSATMSDLVQKIAGDFLNNPRSNRSICAGNTCSQCNAGFILCS
jgi:ATP-dependent RNA helicase RhlE